MRIRNSRPQFPVQYPCAEENALGSSRAHSIQGPLMENLESPSLLRPAIADAGRHKSERASIPEMPKLRSQRHEGTRKRGRPAKMPEMPKLGSQRHQGTRKRGRPAKMPEMPKLGSQSHQGTRKRGRPAKKSRVNKRKNCSPAPEFSRPIVLALRAEDPPAAKKRVRKSAVNEDKGNAVATKIGTVKPPKPDVSEPDCNRGKESTNRIWKSALDEAGGTSAEMMTELMMPPKKRIWKSAVNEDEGNAAVRKTGPVMPSKTDVSEPECNKEKESITRVWKSALNEDYGNAPEPNTGSALPPNPDVSEHDRNQGTESINGISGNNPPPSGSLTCSAEDGVKEDEKVFLEAIHAMQQVKPKRKRGRPRKVPANHSNQS